MKVATVTAPFRVGFLHETDGEHYPIKDSSGVQIAMVTSREDGRRIVDLLMPRRQTCGHECECHPLVHALSEAKAGHVSSRIALDNLISAVETWCANEGIES